MLPISVFRIRIDLPSERAVSGSFFDPDHLVEHIRGPGNCEAAGHVTLFQTRSLVTDVITKVLHSYSVLFLHQEISLRDHDDELGRQM
jgi:hypothetical protein